MYAHNITAKMTNKSQVQTAFYPLWDAKMSIAIAIL